MDLDAGGRKEAGQMGDMPGLLDVHVCRIGDRSFKRNTAGSYNDGDWIHPGASNPNGTRHSHRTYDAA